MTNVGKGVFLGAVVGGVVFFGFGAAAGTIIQEDKPVSVEVGGHAYDDCTKVDTHTWRCT